MFDFANILPVSEFQELFDPFLYAHIKDKFPIPVLSSDNMHFTPVMLTLLSVYVLFILIMFCFSLPVSLYFQFNIPTPSPPPVTPVRITTVTLKHVLHTTSPPTKPPTTSIAPATTTTTTTPITQATTTTTKVVTTTTAPATTSTPTTLVTIPEPAIAPTIPMLPTPLSEIMTTTPSASTLPLPKEHTSEELLLPSETDEALSEAKSVVITMSSLDTDKETEAPLIFSATEDQQLTSMSPSEAEVFLHPEEVTPLVEPVTDSPALPSSPQIVEESPPLAMPPERTQTITQSEAPEIVVANTTSGIWSILTAVPAVLPSDLPVHSEKQTHETDPEVLHLPLEEVGVAENDTTAFSAATVLSGDGEIDHASPGYPRLLDVDSETDYHYDLADLPVSPHGWNFFQTLPLDAPRN